MQKNVCSPFLISAVAVPKLVSSVLDSVLLFLTVLFQFILFLFESKLSRPICLLSIRHFYYINLFTYLFKPQAVNYLDNFFVLLRDWKWKMKFQRAVS